MAAKPETRFITSVHRHLPSKKELHREKMCNPFSGGTADMWYSGSLGDLWVEYKFVPRVPQRGVVAPMKLLSPLQVDWLTGRYEEGRAVAVIIGCPTGGVILQDRAWEQTMNAQTFVSRILPNPALGEWIRSKTMRVSPCCESLQQRCEPQV